MTLGTIGVPGAVPGVVVPDFLTDAGVPGSEAEPGVTLPPLSAAAAASSSMLLEMVRVTTCMCSASWRSPPRYLRRLCLMCAR